MLWMLWFLLGSLLSDYPQLASGVPSTKAICVFAFCRSLKEISSLKERGQATAAEAANLAGGVPWSDAMLGSSQPT